MSFIEKAKAGAALFDGAMGTYYLQKYGHEPEYCEEADLLFPERILGIHREYIAAGCDAIKTNTFGANRLTLECDEEHEAAVIDSGCLIAAEAARNTGVSVFADIGPVPYVKGEDRAACRKTVVDRFIKNGVKYFLFETFPSEDGLLETAEYIKSLVSDATVICSFASTPDGFTREGVPIGKLFRLMEKSAFVDAYGLNCVCGPAHMEQLALETKDSAKPVCVMPNAGYPSLVGNRLYFENNAEYFAKGMNRLHSLGVSILGGCCGTTPEHIALTRAYMGRKADSAAAAAVGNETVSWTAENDFWDKLEAGKKVIAVELDPPVSSDISKFMTGARALKAAGVDAVTLADCPVSRVRIDSSLLACKLKRELSITPIPHMTCRDRNIVATKALLFGLNCEGVNNVLVVTGDPVPTSERGNIKSVFSFNSAVLANYIRELTPELYKGPFRVYGALNLNAVNFSSQLERARLKLDSGVCGFFTQPVHSKRALENLALARESLDCKLLGGVMPIVSYRNACFMNSEISGITVCDEIIQMYEGIDKDEATELAVRLSTEIAGRMEPYIDGYYIMTPFTRTDIVCRLIDNIRKQVPGESMTGLLAW